MSEYEPRTTTPSEELVEMFRRLMRIEKRLGREARFLVVKGWLMVVGLWIEALADEVKRLEAENPITGP
jgi:hypothetical protein